MARPNQLKSNLYKIENYFQTLPLKSFTYNKLYTLIEEHKVGWGISYRKRTKEIIEFLFKNNFLSKTDFFGEHESIVIYSWKTNDDFTVIAGLKSDSYFMYYSALFLHELTQQIPKTFYLNTEHSSNATRNINPISISQEAIDQVFSRDQRKSEHTLSLGEKKIIMTNGKNTGRLGVVQILNERQSFYFTDLERTLIDIVVRPVYAGGVFEILEAYRLAKGKVKVKKIAAYLKKLDYIYPYEQSIGFYLEKAGYAEEEIKLFDKKKSFSFYLTYGIRNRSYAERWKLYYPTGL
jgi:predicted transcriptional regulator of viral defense system